MEMASFYNLLIADKWIWKKEHLIGQLYNSLQTNKQILND